MVTNIENSVYDKKYIIRKKNVITRYAKFCKEVNCKKYAYYNLKMKRKNYIADNI